MSEDLIKRSDAIGAITNHCENECCYRVENWCPQCQREEFQEAIKAVPSADRPQGDVDAVDIFEREMHNLEQGYITIGEFDKRIEPLRHLCYGRPQGEWIYGEHNVAMCDGYRCNRCDFFVPWDYEHKFIDFINDYHYCPSCGARMKGADDYERAIEQMEHDMLYEPTYNSEDGSM